MFNARESTAVSHESSAVSTSRPTTRHLARPEGWDRPEGRDLKPTGKPTGQKTTERGRKPTSPPTTRRMGEPPEATGSTESAEGPSTLRLCIRVAKPHVLEILTPPQWEALPPESKPEEFTRFEDLCYVRVTPEQRKR
jgi:hypothetical protein